MTDFTPDDPKGLETDRGDLPPVPEALTREVRHSYDFDRQVGEVFRRLSLMRAELGEPAFGRAVHAVLAALGGAALEEAERRARTLRLRQEAARSGIRATASARRLDADLWDPGDPD